MNALEKGISGKTKESERERERERERFALMKEIMDSNVDEV